MHRGFIPVFFIAVVALSAVAIGVSYLLLNSGDGDTPAQIGKRSIGVSFSDLLKIGGEKVEFSRESEDFSSQGNEGADEQNSNENLASDGESVQPLQPNTPNIPGQASNTNQNTTSLPSPVPTQSATVDPNAPVIDLIFPEGKGSNHFPLILSGKKFGASPGSVEIISESGGQKGVCPLMFWGDTEALCNDITVPAANQNYIIYVKSADGRLSAGVKYFISN